MKEVDKPSVWSPVNAEEVQRVHVFEPELLNKTVRRTKLKAGRGRMLEKVLTLPLTALALILVFSVIMHIDITLHGRIFTAHVVKREESKTRSKVWYSYVVNGRQYLGDSELPIGNRDAIRAGSIIKVRLLPSVLNGATQIVLSNDNPWREVIWRLFPMSLICLIAGSYIYSLYLSPRFQRRLIARGAITVGQVGLREERRINKKECWVVQYKFAPIEYSSSLLPNSRQATSSITSLDTQEQSKMLHSKMVVADEDASLVKENQLVTVLFDPRKPKRSLIYKFSDYEVVA